MKQKLSILPAFLSLCGLLSGCAGSIIPPEAGDEALAVQLYARGGALEGTGTTTRTQPGEAFTASVAFATGSGQYAPPAGTYGGVWTARVDASGKIGWDTDDGIASPVYPPRRRLPLSGSGSPRRHPAGRCCHLYPDRRTGPALCRRTAWQYVGRRTFRRQHVFSER